LFAITKNTIAFPFSQKSDKHFCFYSLQFAADFVEKTLFKTIMVRLLKSALNTTTKQNFSTILTEEILYVDKQLLAVEKLTNEVSGESLLFYVCVNDSLFMNFA
jgi:AAA15 family ATPase/GTPase